MIMCVGNGLCGFVRPVYNQWRGVTTDVVCLMMENDELKHVIGIGIALFRTRMWEHCNVTIFVFIAILLLYDLVLDEW